MDLFTPMEGPDRLKQPVFLIKSLMGGFWRKSPALLFKEKGWLVYRLTIAKGFLRVFKW